MHLSHDQPELTTRSLGPGFTNLIGLKLNRAYVNSITKWIYSYKHSPGVQSGTHFGLKRLN